MRTNPRSDKPHIWKSTSWKFTCKMDGCPIISNAAKPADAYAGWKHSYDLWQKRGSDFDRYMRRNAK